VLVVADDAIMQSVLVSWCLVVDDPAPVRLDYFRT